MPQLDKRIPKQWLVKKGDPSHRVKSAFRSFDLGLRNCIGQELPMMGVRLILAPSVIVLDVVPQYPKDAHEIICEKVSLHVGAPDQLLFSRRDSNQDCHKSLIEQKWEN